ncbi:MAG TPA: hypothetical protein VNQ77_11715 [Frankiaceae bacterium]|nr:hypothetical protein [Frankiaceae bacterium]
MENLDVLSQTELAAVVGAVNVDKALRDNTGMCGCGIVPETFHTH